MGTDHLPVLVCLGVIIPIANFTSHRYVLKKMDWSSFRSNIDSFVTKNASALVSQTDSPTDRYNLFLKGVDAAILASAPQTQHRSHSSTGNNRITRSNKKRTFVPAPWWNDQCDKAIVERRAATAAFRRLSNYENYISLHKIETKTRRTLNSARSIAFRSFCESIDKMTPISRIWRTVHCLKNRFLQPVVASCSADRNVNDKLHLLAEDMCPSGTSPTASYDFHPENFRNNAFLEAPFNKKEVSMAISALKVKSSPGLDKVENRIIQNFPDSAKTILIDIYNAFIASGSFPSSWNDFLVIFIPKSSPGKLRPIFLASCMLKMMEKLIHSRLNSFLESSNILSNSQFGFRKGRSCANNLAILATEIWSGFVAGEVTAG